MPDERKGPYLIMVSFCENALQEKDDVFSAIRLVDTINVSLEGEEVPQTMPKMLIQPWMIVRFASQNISGKRSLQVTGVAPSGKEQDLFTERPVVFFEKEGTGVNIRIRVGLGLEEIGVYWFRVYLDGKLMGEAPLRITYQATQTAKT